MRIVVAGATGTLGGHVADAVRAAGHDPVSVSRRSGTDLLSGEGLADLLRDASAVIDASSTSSISTKGSVRFFSTVTRNLLAAERTAGVRGMAHGTDQELSSWLARPVGGAELALEELA